MNTADHVRAQALVGKTIASVTTETEVMRDTHKDRVTVERTHITFTDGTWTAFGEIQMDLYANEADVDDDPDVRPTTICGCGHQLVWVDGHWEHNVAPYIWGDDHTPGEPAPTGRAREHWDAEDGVDLGG